MIKTIFDMLQAQDWIGTGSPEIEIAKGKNELPKTFAGFKRKIKRQWQSRKSKT